MDFEYSDDQKALRDLARQILEDKVSNERLKHLAADPRADGFDREVWNELAKANLLGAGLPESVGGSGLGFSEVCLLLHEIGRAVAPVPALATLVYGALPVAQFGSEAQRARLLPGVTSGDTLLSGALVELAGVDPRRPELRARPQPGGDAWRLEGHKACVPAAHLADRVVTSARTADGSVGLFLVDPKAAGLGVERQEATSGEPQFHLELRDVAVPAEDVLGDPTAGFAMIDWLCDRALAAVAATQLGCAERMLEMTAEYGRERQQFSRPIGSFQAFHTRAADAWISVEALRLATWEAVWRLDAGLDASEALHIAQYWAGEPAYRVAFACSHLHGGIGSDTDYPLHRYYLWIKQLELTLGSGSDHLRALGAELAERAARS